MNGKYRYLLKNTGILALGNISSKILTFLLVPLYTSVLSTQEFGVYDLVAASVQLIYPLLSLNIVDAVLRFMLDADRHEKQIATIGARFVSISCVLAILLLIVVRNTSIGTVLRGYEGYIFLYYVFFVFNQYFIQLAKGLERISEMAIAGVLGVIVMVVANVMFLLVFHWRLEGFFIANILAQAIPVAFYVLRLKIWRYWTFEKSEKALLAEMLRYCIPIIATGIAWSINSSADKYIVTFVIGVSANGLLAVAYKIPGIINVFQGIFIQAWHISGVKEFGAEDSGVFYGQIFSMTNLAMSIPCALLIQMTKPLAHFLYAKDFFDAWQYVPFLLITSVVNSASGVLGPVMSAQKNSKGMAISAIYGIFSNIVLNLILVQVMGIHGVTIATAISSVVIFAVRRKWIGHLITLPDEWRVMATWAVLCVQAIVVIWMGNTLVECALLIAIFVLNRALIMRMWSVLKNLF